VRIFNDDVVLINPNIDASDKEIYKRNGYKNIGKNLVAFINNGESSMNSKNVFKPLRFG
jgi:hypothetical protein